MSINENIIENDNENNNDNDNENENENIIENNSDDDIENDNENEVPQIIEENTEATGIFNIAELLVNALNINSEVALIQQAILNSLNN